MPGTYLSMTIRRGRSGVRVLALTAIGAIGAVSLAGCSKPPATPTPATVTVTQPAGASTSPSPTPPPSPSDVDVTTPAVDAVLPSDLVGTWQSVDQGSAEVLYSFWPDGRFTRAEVMMQLRSSGTFDMSVGTKGVAAVRGSTLRLQPKGGVQSLHDPDAPSSSYDNRPLDDLTPETYQWGMQGAQLVLVGRFGPVAYDRMSREPTQ